jgi:hypothetical protein
LVASPGGARLHFPATAEQAADGPREGLQARLPGVFADNLAFFLLPAEMRTLGRTKKEGVS